MNRIVTSYNIADRSDFRVYPITSGDSAQQQAVANALVGFCNSIGRSANVTLMTSANEAEFAAEFATLAAQFAAGEI